MDRLRCQAEEYSKKSRTLKCIICLIVIIAILGVILGSLRCFSLDERSCRARCEEVQLLPVVKVIPPAQPPPGSLFVSLHS